MKWKDSNLKSFHLQDEFFGLRSEEELQELDEAIERNGMGALDIIIEAQRGVLVAAEGNTAWFICSV